MQPIFSENGGVVIISRVKIAALIAQHHHEIVKATKVGHTVVFTLTVLREGCVLDYSNFNLKFACKFSQNVTALQTTYYTMG